MTRADWLLLVALGFVIGAGFRLFWGPAGDARTVAISSPDGTQEVPLDIDRELAVQGPLGTSVLEIRDGAVRFASSPCRHQICVRSGWHRHGGAVAACVPNRISILLGGVAADYDGLSY